VANLTGEAQSGFRQRSQPSFGDPPAASRSVLQRGQLFHSILTGDEHPVHSRHFHPSACAMPSPTRRDSCDRGEAARGVDALTPPRGVAAGR